MSAVCAHTVFALINHRSKKLINIVIKVILLLSVTVFVCSVSVCPSYFVKENCKETFGASNMKERYNFLLLGLDRSERLSDVIMLVSADIDKKEITVAQIPRDTYAEYTSAAYRKLNGAVSSLNGGRAVADFLENVFKITIDYYITVDLDGVAKAVDELGGVEVDIPEDMVYEDPYQDLSIELKAGRQLLDGEKAKQFIRYRSGYLRGDIARLDAQKIFLSALFEKLLSCGFPKLITTSQKLINASESDAPFAECLKIVSKYTETKAKDIKLITMPGSDVRSAGGAWYYVLNKKETYNVLSRYFGCQSDISYVDPDRLLTGVYSKEFNSIYDAQSGYEYKIYTADSINSDGVEIEMIN